MNVIPDTIDFSAYLKGPDENANVKPASSWLDEVIDAFEHPARITGTRLPWAKTEAIVRLRRGELTIWPGMNGHGKALAVDTEIPTEGGWKRMGEICVGDRVFDERGELCNVVACTEVMHDRPCYTLVFSDGTSVVADENHEWMTHSAQARHSWRNARDNGRMDRSEPKKCGTDQSAKRAMPCIKTTAEIARSVRVTEGKAWNGKVQHSIPLCGVLNLATRDLPIDPYVLGVWLGDGDSRGAGLTSADEEIVNEMRAAGIIVTERKARFRFGLTGGLQAQLRSAGLIENKHVPTEYMRGSPDQRLALLQGLMDTDGHVTSYGRCEFVSMLPHLADAVYELVTSLGVQARVITGVATLKGKVCGTKYRVTFTPRIQVFRLSRKSRHVRTSTSCRIAHRFIVSCEKIASVPVRCIQVDSASHLYLATRAMIPTHNSMLIGQVMLHAMAAGEKVCIASMEMKPAATMQRICRQAFGTNAPSVRNIRDLHTWTDSRLWLYDQQGDVSPDRILAVARYAHAELGVTHFVIDNLLSCGIPEDGEGWMSRQKGFVLSLANHAHDTQQSVHLLAHVRKGKDEMAPPSKYDVRGSASITDLADNVFTVWRNKAKEKARADDDHSKDGDADCLLIVDKHRHGEWEGTIRLWFDPASQAYSEAEGAHPPIPKLMSDHDEVEF